MRSYLEFRPPVIVPLQVAAYVMAYLHYYIIAWLFTECDVARNSHVLHWKFSVPRATFGNIKQATVHCIHANNHCLMSQPEL